MLIAPATVTVERKQYQPLGFDRRIVLRPITLTAGRTRIRAGLSVGASLPDWAAPIPKTLTPVPITLSAGLPFLKGADLPHEVIQAARTSWSLANGGAGNGAVG